MNSKSREELVEQYEDAAFALLMSEYAEQEGDRLLREFDEAKAKGEVPEIPAALDAKCRKMIRQAYEKQRRKEQVNRVLRTIGRTAAMLFAALGICGTLVFSVEALRTPFVNFLMDQQEHFFAIDFDQEATKDPDKAPNSVRGNECSDGSPLDAFVPEGYELSRYTVKEDGSVTIIYKNEIGKSIFFSSSVTKGKLNLDTENADSESMEIAGHSGIFVNKDGVLTITWFNAESEQTYQLRTTDLDLAEFWILAEQVASNYEGE